MNVEPDLQDNIHLDDIVGARVVHAHSVHELDVGVERHGLVRHERDVLWWRRDARQERELLCAGLDRYQARRGGNAP